jgi:hypothetical protein
MESVARKHCLKEYLPSTFAAALMYAVVLVSSAAGQTPDFEISNCSAAPDPNDSTSLIVEFDVAILPADLSGSWDLPVDVLVNGSSVEQHTLVIVDVGGTPCPAIAGGVCAQPAPPCGKRNWTFKSLSSVPGGDPATCVPEGSPAACKCLFPKIVTAKVKSNAATPSGFTIVTLDPENAFAEANETNNSCKVRFSGGTIPTVSEWGLAVMAILVLTGATVVIMRRRAAVA